MDSEEEVIQEIEYTHVAHKIIMCSYKAENRQFFKYLISFTFFYLIVLVSFPEGWKGKYDKK